MSEKSRPTPETAALWQSHSGTNEELALDALKLCEKLERQLAEAREQRDGLAEKCRLLLDSPNVQGSWPLVGTTRAEVPSDTHSSATATVKFRHLLGIHVALGSLKGGDQ